MKDEVRKGEEKGMDGRGERKKGLKELGNKGQKNRNKEKITEE